VVDEKRATVLGVIRHGTNQDTAKQAARMRRITACPEVVALANVQRLVRFTQRPVLLADAVAFRKVDSCREIPIAPGTGSWFEGVFSPTIASAVHSVCWSSSEMARYPAGIDSKPNPEPRASFAFETSPHILTDVRAGWHDGCTLTYRADGHVDARLRQCVVSAKERRDESRRRRHECPRHVGRRSVRYAR
jgi:hypothetical protein